VFFIWQYFLELIFKKKETPVEVADWPWTQWLKHTHVQINKAESTRNWEEAESYMTNLKLIYDALASAKEKKEKPNVSHFKRIDPRMDHKK
jgi:hypothetical protein